MASPCTMLGCLLAIPASWLPTPGALPLGPLHGTLSNTTATCSTALRDLIVRPQASLNQSAWLSSPSPWWAACLTSSTPSSVRQSQNMPYILPRLSDRPHTKISSKTYRQTRHIFAIYSLYPIYAHISQKKTGI